MDCRDAYAFLVACATPDDRRLLAATFNQVSVWLRH